MPLDPNIEALLNEGEDDGPSFALGVEESRAAEYDFIELCGPEEPVASVVDHRVPVAGGEVTVRVYTPEGSGPFPGFVYFHGGGWVAGDINTMDRPCRTFANGGNVVVVSVEYRCAPEHRFPAAAEDSYAAVRWTAEHAAELNIDPARIGVGGDSAGGNLSAVTSQMARDRGGPPLRLQLLIYPVIDHDLTRASYDEVGDGYGLTTPMMAWFWDQYIPDPSARDNPYAAPIRAADLSGLPPAVVQVAYYDPLRDEGLAYAEALRAAGGTVDARTYDTLVHGWLQMGSFSDDSRQATMDGAAAIRAHLGTLTAAPA
jgi:acetyl esterase